MPAASAVSIMPGALRDADLAAVDGDRDEVYRHASSCTGTSIWRSHVRVVLVDRGEDVVEGRLAAERAAALVDVLPELLAELRHVARDRHRGGVAERAEAVAEDPVADVEQ